MDSVSEPQTRAQVAASNDRITLTHLPTPLEPLNRLSAHLGDSARIWVKRDDCTTLGAGGNKTRKLEFLMADARNKRTDIVITSGAVQSNHARLTAAACARLGYDCELFLARRVDLPGASYERSGNVLLDRMFGAHVQLLPAGADAELAAEHRERQLRAKGRRPYLIPAGGSNEVGCRGYVECARELVQQARQCNIDFHTVFLPAGSAGTAAGLAVGLGERGWTGTIRAIAVSTSQAVVLARIQELTESLRAASGTNMPLPEMVADDRFLGAGYGMPTERSLSAINLAAALEGLLLDPVYTGKAMAAVLDAIQTGAVEGDVVFLHTGGSPALFGYWEVI